MRQVRKQLPMTLLAGEFRTATFDAEKRTVDVVASVGSRVKRGGFFSEPFFQELEISKRAIRLTRYKNGAPILDNHGRGLRDGASLFAFGIRDVMGVTENPRIEKVEVRNEDGKKEEKNALVVTVRFSEREEFAGLVRDIGNGIIRNVSVGFNIHRNKELEERVGEAKIFRATDWEPVELSFVPAGADPAAVTRNMPSNNDCVFEFLTDERSENMGQKTENKPAQSPEGQARSASAEPASEPKTEQAPNVDDIRKAAIESERVRAKEIRSAVSAAKFEPAMAEEMIERGISADEARTEVLAKLAQKDAESSTRSTNVQVGSDLNAEGLRNAISSALLLRSGHFRIDQRSEEFGKMEAEAKPYRFMRLLDLAAVSLQSRGISTNGMAPMELAARALHSTSDFPEILANVVNKTLRRSYQESPATWMAFTQITEVADFREIARVQLGDASKLEKKLENGEYRHGTIGEAAEKYRVEEYGKLIAIGRRMIVNDDLQAFSQLPAKMGIQARNLESDLIWADLLSNPVMGDGVALFHASHGNLGTAAALGETPLAEARKLLRLQKGLGGNKLNLTPRSLYVPAALETTADKLTAAITPHATNDANMFGPTGKTPLMAIAEPRIDDSSATEFYVMADLGQVDIYEMAMLQGERGPVTDSMVDFNTDGIKFKIRHTVGVKAIDYRGMVKNVGA